MLVLSRRPDEKILLPSVPATIQLISAQTGLARLGIEAPAHVPILREELVRTNHPPIASRPIEAPTLGQALHHLALGLNLLRVHLDDTDLVGRQMLANIEEEMEALRRHVTGNSTSEPLVVPVPT